MAIEFPRADGDVVNPEDLNVHVAGLFDEFYIDNSGYLKWEEAAVFKINGSSYSLASGSIASDCADKIIILDTSGTPSVSAQATTYTSYDENKIPILYVRSDYEIVYLYPCRASKVILEQSTLSAGTTTAKLRPWKQIDLIGYQSANHSGAAGSGVIIVSLAGTTIITVAAFGNGAISYSRTGFFQIRIQNDKKVGGELRYVNSSKLTCSGFCAAFGVPEADVIDHTQAAISTTTDTDDIVITLENTGGTNTHTGWFRIIGFR